VPFKHNGLTDKEIVSFFKDCICPRYITPLYVREHDILVSPSFMEIEVFKMINKFDVEIKVIREEYKEEINKS